MYAYIFRERERETVKVFFFLRVEWPQKNRSFRVASGSVSTFGSTFWTRGTCRCAIWTLRDGAWHIWANASRWFLFCFHFFITVIKQFLPNLIIFTTPSTGPKDIWKLQSQHATLQEEATAQADGLFTVQIFFLQWQSAQSSCVFVTFQSTIPCRTGSTNATTKQGHETRWHQSVGWMIQWRIQYINIISGFTAAAEFLKFGLLQQTSHLVLHTGTDPRKISGTTHQHHLTKQVADVFLCVLALGLWLNKNQWFLTCAKVYYYTIKLWSTIGIVGDGFHTYPWPTCVRFSSHQETSRDTKPWRWKKNKQKDSGRPTLVASRDEGFFGCAIPQNAYGLQIAFG